MTWTDIDAVVIGKAPDIFEGVMMPELYLADALGARRQADVPRAHRRLRRRLDRLVAASLVQAGIHERVLTVAFEKQSESDAMWALSLPLPFQPPMLAGAGGYFAPLIRAYMRRSGAPDHIGILVAREGPAERARRTRTRTSTCDDITLREGRASRRCCGTRSATSRPARPPTAPARWCSPTRPAATRAAAAPPAWVHGTAMRSEPTMFAGRDAGEPAGAARTAPPTSTRRPASPTRAARSTCVEMYVPFSWYEPMWLENLGFAPRATAGR